MAETKPKSKEIIPYEDLDILEEGYAEKLDKDIKYSIAIDPEDKYGLSQSQKDFIEFYVQWKNIPLAAKMAGVDKDTAMQYYNSYGVKREINRISLALYHRSFATKMLNLDEIGGYLTSLVVDQNVPEADKLNVKDKIGVVKLLADIIDKKQKAMVNPENIIDVDINEELENLSIDAIHSLISSSGNGKDRKTKEEIIEEIKALNDDRLSIEEISQLSMLTVSQLTEIVNRLAASVSEKDEDNGEKYEN